MGTACVRGRPAGRPATVQEIQARGGEHSPDKRLGVTQFDPSAVDVGGNIDIDMTLSGTTYFCF